MFIAALFRISRKWKTSKLGVQKLENTQTLLNNRNMDKQTAVFWYNGILLSNFKEGQIANTHKNVDESQNKMLSKRSQTQRHTVGFVYLKFKNMQK